MAPININIYNRSRSRTRTRRRRRSSSSTPRRRRRDRQRQTRGIQLSLQDAQRPPTTWVGPYEAPPREWRGPSTATQRGGGANPPYPPSLPAILPPPTSMSAAEQFFTASSTIQTYSTSLRRPYGEAGSKTIGKQEDINYELEQAAAWDVVHMAPKPGSLVLQASNPELWKFVPFEEVNTFEGRSNWIRPSLETAQELSDADLAPTIQALHGILLRTGFVHPMSPAVLRPFVTALMVNQLPVTEVIENALSYQRDGLNLWIFRMKGLPGPTFSENVSPETKYYHWFHACTAATIMGLCRTGYMLPTCNDGTDGTQLPTNSLLFGFFGKVCTMDPTEYEKLIQETFAMHSHPKNPIGITVSGGILGNHVKIPSASTWLEQFLCVRSGLVSQIISCRQAMVYQMRSFQSTVCRIDLQSKLEDDSSSS